MISAFNLYDSQGQYFPVTWRTPLVSPTNPNPTVQTPQSVSQTPKNETPNNSTSDKKEQRQEEQTLMRSGDRGRVINMLV
jgi:hypothetical protein